MSNPKSSLMKPPAFKKKVEKIKQFEEESEEEEEKVIDTTFVAEPTKILAVKNPLEDLFRQEMAAMKQRILTLEQQVKQGQGRRQFVLPTRSAILEWCKAHPKHHAAQMILKYGHSWAGPGQAHLDVMQDMLKEGIH